MDFLFRDKFVWFSVIEGPNKDG